MRERMYWRAFHMLAHDFHTALRCSPWHEVGTPHGAREEAAVIEVVVQLIAASRPENETLANMLRVVMRAARRGDPDAADIISALSTAHARQYACLMQAAGDFEVTAHPGDNSRERPPRPVPEPHPRVLEETDTTGSD